MALYYGLADVALLGGSFAPLGGQNLIEAAACGCPVVMGRSPSTSRKPPQLALAAGASLRVPDMEHAVTAALKLAENPERRGPMAEAALAFASRTAARPSARRRRCWRSRRRPRRWARSGAGSRGWSRAGARALEVRPARQLIELPAHTYGARNGGRRWCDCVKLWGP